MKACYNCVCCEAACALPDILCSSYSPSGRVLLAEFAAKPTFRKTLADSFDLFAAICTEAAASRGFHDDEIELTEMVPDELRQWTADAILQAELARQMSEIAEAVEAVRKPSPDHHLPEYSNFLVEEADAIIRIGDTVGKRNLAIGSAIVDKLMYNLTRPYKHGKGS